MRVLALLVALLALAPGAAAQSFLPPGNASLQVMPPSDPVPPLRAPLLVPAKLVVACDASYVGQPIHAQVLVSRLPAWATVVVSPPAFDGDGTACAQGGQLSFAASLSISASDQAPAFTPDVVELTAEVQSPLRQPTLANATFPVSAGFLSILDVSAVETQREVPAGGIAVLPVRIVNLGNANTKVSFEVGADAEDLVVPAPATLVLQSKQAGGSEISAVVPLEVHRRMGSTATGTEHVTLRWTSSYALDGKLRGDAGAMTFLIHPGGALDAAQAEDFGDVEHRVPAPGFALLALGVVGSALLARRWTR